MHSTLLSWLRLVVGFSKEISTLLSTSFSESGETRTSSQRPVMFFGRTNLWLSHTSEPIGVVIDRGAARLRDILANPENRWKGEGQRLDSFRNWRQFSVSKGALWHHHASRQRCFGRSTIRERFMFSNISSTGSQEPF